MRMLHYFAGLMLVVVPALLATAGLGIAGDVDLHLNVGLFTAILTVALHTLVILFMIVTGRVLREAVRSRELPREFLEELNQFFARKQAYPAAVFGAVAIVAAGVLGYGAPSLGLSPGVHMIAGLVALAFNLWALPIEYSALRDNRDLLDRAAVALDKIDLELEARGELPVDEPISAERIGQGAMIVAISAWMPYLYWVLVEFRGDFSRASLHPWVEVSILSLGVWWLARREMARENAVGDGSSPRDGSSHRKGGPQGEGAGR